MLFRQVTIPGGPSPPSGLFRDANFPIGVLAFCEPNPS